jgi:hypothetical protein
MRKFLLIILILFLSYLVWSKYGYLLESLSNLPPHNPQISNEPILLTPSLDSDLAHIRVPSGYSLSYFTKDVPGARSLTVGNNGIVYVGTRGEGVVYALKDADGDGTADNRYVVASKLNSPNGVAYQDDTLYVAEIGRIIKFENIDERYADNPPYSVVYEGLPKDTHHGWRYLSVGPDNKLYLGIGAPCNTCEVSDPYGSLARLNMDGTGFEVIARGVRNTVGFDWNPEDESLWFTDNGRDQLGEDVPKDELNQLKTEEEHFGFPYCHDGSILDPKFGSDKSCDDYERPSLSLSPHAAALGMRFIGGKILIAEHGSWNRKDPIGYRVMSVDINNGVASNYQVFIDGWLGADDKAKGRPVDILQLSDGSLLISDDFAGAIYRLAQKP